MGTCICWLFIDRTNGAAFLEFITLPMHKFVCPQSNVIELAQCGWIAILFSGPVSKELWIYFDKWGFYRFLFVCAVDD